MNSFIPWVGGKGKLLWIINKLMPDRYTRFIDVFGGSGTVTMCRPIQRGCIEVYNDFNSNLTNLFCCVKNRPMALLAELGFLPLNTRDDFNVLYKFFSKGEFTDDYRKAVTAELETALSIITTAYLRSEDLQTAVEENINYLNPPVHGVFRSFLTRIKHIDPDMNAALAELKSAIDNEVWREWCEALSACQYDHSMKSTLTRSGTLTPSLISCGNAECSSRRTRLTSTF